MKNKNIKEVVKKIITKYDRVLVGFAHSDTGKKVKGCNCCYCNPNYKEDKNV